MRKNDFETEPVIKKKSPLIAVLLSLIFGGGGQIYIGQTIKGIALTLFILVSSVFSIGLIFIPIVVYDAYILSKKIKTGETVEEWEFFWSKSNSNKTAFKSTKWQVTNVFLAELLKKMDHNNITKFLLVTGISGILILTLLGFSLIDTLFDTLGFFLVVCGTIPFFILTGASFQIIGNRNKILRDIASIVTMVLIIVSILIGVYLFIMESETFWEVIVESPNFYYILFLLIYYIIISKIKK